MEFEVTTRSSESAVIVCAVGPIDSNTAKLFQEPLLHAIEHATGTIQIDLAEVPFMSSAGLRVLLMATKALQKRGERLKLLNVPTPVYMVLHMANFTSFIDVDS